MWVMTLEELPGGDLVAKGMADLEGGRETLESLLVAVGAPRLRRLGFAPHEPLPADPEHRLYELLAANDPDSAHARYNALLLRLVSFERAAACAG
jgi:hypothetical protein